MKGALGEQLGTLWLRALMVFFGALPHRVALGLGWLVAEVTWALGVRRRVLLDNLERVLGGLTGGAERRQIARRAHRNLCLSAVEMLRASARPCARLVRHVRTETPELLRRVAEEPRATIAAVFHSGNVDLIGLWWSRRHPGRPLWAVMKPLEVERYNRLLLAARRRWGFGIIDAKSPGAIARINALLARAAIVCMLPDQHARKSGITVEFLGQPATMYKGVAAAWLRHPEARVLVVVDRRLDDGPEHVLHAAEVERPPPSGDRAEDLRAMLQRLCDVAGELILRHPESYLWHHRLWRAGPERGERPRAHLPAGEPDARTAAR
ncbi:MAG: hypothetical protein KatS3mg102_0376 [Planctomycetota bacterium]|nr:MAG: hypothetical protein KatS3mg102_0376 [Planctomycetota bacterium]